MGVVVNCFYRGRTSVVYVNVSCDTCGAADGSALGKLPWEQQRECGQGPHLEQGEALKHLINSPVWGNDPDF